MNLEPLEVFALTSDMQRATGSIPYTSLMWDRKYYEPGSFLMELPANVYDPSWAYIYTDERPETGIIQKVEYSDTATTAGGVDTVILSGFFLEHELNRYTFLVEETEEEAYRIYKPAPAKTVKPTLWQAEGGQTYVKTGSGSSARWETLEGDYVDPAKLDTSGLTQLEMGAGEGMKLIEYPTTNTDRFPTGKWTANEYTNGNYSYYSEDGETLHSVAPDGTEKTFPILRGGTGDVIYEGEDGELKWVNGVASSLGGTYVRARDSWESMVRSEGLEVVTGDGTIMGGSTYARAYRTVKGPWQLRTELDVNEPADNVQRIIQWAQDIWGNNLLYDEVGFAGEEKIIDPSLKLFGDLAYDELKTIGASPRLSYSFESDTCVFEIWRGLDRTQSQAGVPAPPTPDEPEPDEPTIDELYEAVDYIEATGEQYIDTGVVPNGSTRVVCDFQLTESFSTSKGIFGSRESDISTSFALWHILSGTVRSDYYGTYKTLSIGSDLSRVTVDKDGNVTSVVGGGTLTYDEVSSSSAYPIFLFAVNHTGSANSQCSARMYGCQIYADGTALTMNLMPYRRKADGVFGLLDLANEVFYESASGVPFTGPSYPAGTYEELDYIVSTGTQYIDTGFNPKFDTRVAFDISDLSSDSVQLLLGSRSAGGPTADEQFVIYRNTATTIRSDYFNGGNKTLTISDMTGRTVIDKNTNVTTAFGVTVTDTAATSGEVPYPLYLFGLNDIGKLHAETAKMKGHSCRIYDGATLARDYVPRRRVSDGAVGFLDLVHGVFYTSAGSEPFLAPGELPSGYTRLEYIEGTGTQYIDTGYVPNQDTRLKMNALFTPKSDSSYLYGVRTSSSTQAFAFSSYSNIYQVRYASNSTTFTNNDLTDVYAIDHNKNVFSINGVETISHDYASFTSPGNMYIFAMNSGGSIYGRCAARVCDCQIYSNGTLSRDYIPAKNSSGEAGLFDLVTMSFFVDASGTGFIAGPEISQVAAVAASEPTTYALVRTATEDDSNTAANPFAVFSDTWGTLYGFTASKDVSNYRNTCYVLYQFRDQTDADGNPIGPRGFVKARLEDELPDAETYLDLRGEEPEDDQTDEAFIESLRQRGLAHLQANYAAIESLDTGTLTGNGYLDGYDLGDKVDMLVEAIGLVKEARITGVCEVHEAGSSTATLEIGEQKLTNIRKAVIV